MTVAVNAINILEINTFKQYYVQKQEFVYLSVTVAVI